MRGGSGEGGRVMRGLGEEMREGACDEGRGLSQVVSETDRWDSCAVRAYHRNQSPHMKHSPNQCSRCIGL